MYRKILYFAIAISLLWSFYYFFFEKKSEKVDNPPPYSEKNTNEKNTIELNKNISLTFKASNIKKQSMNELYLFNKNANHSQLLFKSNTPIYLAETSDKQHIINQNEQFIFGVYEKSKRVITTDFTYDRKGEGEIFVVDENGEIVHRYKTNYIFEKLKDIDGQVFLFEKMLHDPERLFPRHLKPYYIIKKVYLNGNFKEVDRYFFNPIDELK